MGRKHFKTHRRAASSLTSPILCGPPARWARELKSVGPNAKVPADQCGRCERSLAAISSKPKPAAAKKPAKKK